MNKDKNKLIPELRFPEFANEGEWVKNVLGELIKIKSGYSPSKYNLQIIGKYPFVKVEDLNNCNKYQITSREYSDDIENIIPKDSVIFPKRGAAIELNKVRVNQVAILMDTNLMAITPNKKINVEFLYYIILKVGLYKIADTSTIPQINNKHIEPYEINLPQPQEQQKIASCLSSLDEVIAAHSQKLEVLKEHKKGLMQNLFPQEGESVPKYRFPEFEKDGDWVEKSLDSLTTKISDGIHTTPNYDDNGEYYFINGNNLIDGKIWIDEKTKRVSVEEYKIHKRDLSESTILLSINGTIGLIAVYNNEKVILGKSACYINVNGNKVDKTFIKYFIQTGSSKSYFNSELTGSTIKNLSLKSIKETIIKVPIKPQEQQKIASCLSSLDDLITAQSEKIEQLQLHKKGLMQGLFPKLITD